MNDIEKKVLAKVSTVLGALKLKYAIIDSDGKKHGELELAPPKPKRKGSIYGYGVMTNYLRPYFGNFPSNTSKVIPAGRYDVEVVRGSVCNMATKLWGAGNYTSHLTADRKGVHITRLDKDVNDFLGASTDDLFDFDE